jgi:ribosomal protein L2
VKRRPARATRIRFRPWGMPTKGYKTRKNKRTSKFIVRDRRG